MNKFDQQSTLLHGKIQCKQSQDIKNMDKVLATSQKKGYFP